MYNNYFTYTFFTNSKFNQIQIYLALTLLYNYLGTLFGFMQIPKLTCASVEEFKNVGQNECLAYLCLFVCLFVCSFVCLLQGLGCERPGLPS